MFLSVETFAKASLLCLILGTTQFVWCAEETEKTSFEAIVSSGMKDIPEKYKDWLIKQELCSFQIRTTPRDYREILHKIVAISRHVKKTAIVGSLEQNRQKNLHSTTLPYDETRTLRNKKDFYISASDVLTPEQSYIVSQAPSERTVLDFWTTILETNTRYIVALAMPRGENVPFAPYWVKERFPLQVNEWTIQSIEKSIIATSATNPNQHIVQRMFRAKKGGHSRKITHIHYENWPDFRTPAEDLFQTLLNLLSVQKTSPILVHCSAGMGRAGTLVATDSLLKEAKKQPLGSPFQVNIPKRIVELRMQRRGLVSTHVQLEAVYRAVAKGVESQGLIEAVRTTKGLSPRPNS